MCGRMSKSRDMEVHHRTVQSRVVPLRCVGTALVAVFLSARGGAADYVFAAESPSIDDSNFLFCAAKTVSKRQTSKTVPEESSTKSRSTAHVAGLVGSLLGGVASTVMVDDSSVIHGFLTAGCGGLAGGAAGVVAAQHMMQVAGNCFDTIVEEATDAISPCVNFVTRAVGGGPGDSAWKTSSILKERTSSILKERTSGVRKGRSRGKSARTTGGKSARTTGGKSAGTTGDTSEWETCGTSSSGHSRLVTGAKFVLDASRAAFATTVGVASGAAIGGVAGFAAGSFFNAVHPDPNRLPPKSLVTWNPLPGAYAGELGGFCGGCVIGSLGPFIPAIRKALGHLRHRVAKRLPSRLLGRPHMERE